MTDPTGLTLTPSILLAAPGLVCRRGAGPSEHVIDLARALARATGRPIDVLFARIEAPPTVPEMRLFTLGRHGGIGRSDSLTLGVNPWGYGRHVVEVSRFCREAPSYDLVIERMWGFGGMIGRKLQARPVDRRGDGARVSGDPGRGGRRKPILFFEENGPLRWHRTRCSPGNAVRRLYYRAARARLQRVYRLADRIIVQAPGLVERMVREFGLAARSMVVVPNGIDATGIRARPEGRPAASGEQATHGPRRLVYAGSLDAVHPLEPVCLAVGQARRQGIAVELHLFGAGDSEPALRQLTDDDRDIVWHGRVSRERLVEMLPSMDLGLAPYSDVLFGDEAFEFSPLKLLEYMAAGLPVATMPGGPDGGLIDPGINGYLVENTTAAWLDLITRLPEAGVLRSMGRGNPERVAAMTWEAVAARYLELYAEVARQSA